MNKAAPLSRLLFSRARLLHPNNVPISTLNTAKIISGTTDYLSFNQIYQLVICVARHNFCINLMLRSTGKTVPMLFITKQILNTSTYMCELPPPHNSAEFD